MFLQAESHLKAGEELDPYDYLVKYYLALHYAMARQVDVAFKYVRKTLEVKYSNCTSYLLSIYSQSQSVYLYQCFRVKAINENTKLLLLSSIQ